MIEPIREMQEQIARLESQNAGLGFRLDDELDANAELRQKLAKVTAERDEYKKKYETEIGLYDIECPCCGGVAATGEVQDGQELACGCAGNISCDGEEDPAKLEFERDRAIAALGPTARELAEVKAELKSLNRYVDELESKCERYQRERDEGVYVPRLGGWL